MKHKGLNRVSECNKQTERFSNHPTKRWFSTTDNDKSVHNHKTLLIIIKSARHNHYKNFNKFHSAEQSPFLFTQPTFPSSVTLPQQSPPFSPPRQVTGDEHTNKNSIMNDQQNNNIYHTKSIRQEITRTKKTTIIFYNLHHYFIITTART